MSSIDSSASRAGKRRRLRVLLFTNSVAVGGMERHVELLARHLDRQRFEVFGVCPDWEPTAPFTRSLAVVVDGLATITPDRRYGLLGLAAETARLASRIRQWRIDVMHMHSTTYAGEWWALIAARAAGVRRIFVTEHLAPEHPVPGWKRLLRAVFGQAATGLVCVSRKNFEARSRYLHTSLARTCIVNNGVDVDDFPAIPAATLDELRARVRIPAGAEVVGTAVRFEPEKGLGYLVDAMPLVLASRPDAWFLLVGDGSLRQELESRVARSGVADRVRFVGFQSDPRPYLALMDAFVLPVPVGSMSIGLLEAMALRRAVVIAFGGEGEAVIHGETGFCAEPRSATSIARFVTQILADSELRHRLGAAARLHVEREFSAQAVARSLGDLYEWGRIPSGARPMTAAVSDPAALAPPRMRP